MAYFSKYNGKIVIFYIKLKSNVKLNGEFSDFVYVFANCQLRFRQSGTSGKKVDFPVQWQHSANIMLKASF